MQQIKLIDNQSNHFKFSCYPDGQKNITLNLEMLDVKIPVKIICRIKYFSELEVLACLIAALRKYDFFIKEIEFAYLFGIRSDRSFEVGQPNYFRDVLAPIINQFKIPYISIVWPFSPLPISYDCILNGYYKYYSFCPPDINLWISGDATANKFQENYQPSFHKARDCDGKITVELKKNTMLSIAENVKRIKKILIVDDLCDGGKTFITEAEYLKEFFPSIKLELFVYHGLFTQGLKPLLEHFEKIYCTNSYQEISHPQVTQFKVI